MFTIFITQLNLSAPLFWMTRYTPEKEICSCNPTLAITHSSTDTANLGFVMKCNDVWREWSVEESVWGNVFGGPCTVWKAVDVDENVVPPCFLFRDVSFGMHVRYLKSVIIIRSLQHDAYWSTIIWINMLWCLLVYNCTDVDSVCT